MSFELIIPFLRPIEPLLLDDSISEIMGNPDSSWWYERDGIMRRDESIQFDAERLRTGLEVVANKLGKKLDEDNPLLNAQLPDGSRLAAVIPPVVRPAPAMVIRKVHQPPLYRRRPHRWRHTSAFASGVSCQPDRARPNHHYQWRNRDREDHPLEHSWPVDSRPRTNRHHRGHQRASHRKAEPDGRRMPDRYLSESR